MVLETIILATVFVSLISLVGVILVPLKEKTVESLMIIMISFATGTLFATAFLDALPEAIEKLNAPDALRFTLIGVIIFFIVEKFIRKTAQAG